MAGMLRVASLALAFVSTVPMVSSAQTAADIASSWGLIGTWQVQCGGALGDSNPVYTYRANGPRIELDRDFGDNRRDTNMVTGLRRGASGEISYTVIFATTEPPQNREHCSSSRRTAEQCA